jgi:hypothetical protein
MLHSHHATGSSSSGHASLLTTLPLDFSQLHSTLVLCTHVSWRRQSTTLAAADVDCDIIDFAIESMVRWHLRSRGREQLS